MNCVRRVALRAIKLSGSQTLTVGLRALFCRSVCTPPVHVELGDGLADVGRHDADDEEARAAEEGRDGHVADVVRCARPAATDNFHDTEVTIKATECRE